jgi:hypothetical protein
MRKSYFCPRSLYVQPVRLLLNGSHEAAGLFKTTALILNQLYDYCCSWNFIKLSLHDSCIIVQAVLAHYVISCRAMIPEIKSINQ